MGWDMKNQRISALINRLPAYFAALFISAFFTAFAAQAQFEVEEAEIEKGEIEVEAHGAHFSGFPKFMVVDDDEEEGFESEVVRNGVSLEVGFGITDWLKLSVEAEFEEERSGDGSWSNFEFTEVGVGAKVELLEAEDDGVGIAFLVEFEKAVREEKTLEIEGDEFELEAEDEGKTLSFGPIFALKNGPWSATTNLLFSYVFDGKETESEGDVDNGALEVEEVTVTKADEYWNFDYAVQVKYQITNMFGVGVEAYGTITDIGDTFEDSADKHRLGPVLYVNFGDDDDGDEGEVDNDEEEEEGPEVAMAFGVLFGLNDDTSDIAVKWDMEVEF